MIHQQIGSAKLVVIAVVLAICGILAIAVFSLPKGFKSDLSLVEKGSASIVLLLDNNLVGGTTTMALLNKVRPDYEDKVEFLVVDIATPVGRKFMRQQGVNVIDLVLFGSDGTRQRVLNGGVSEQDLRLALDDILKH